MENTYAVSLSNLGPLGTVYGRLDIDIKSQRHGSACLYNCRALCNFGFKF